MRVSPGTVRRARSIPLLAHLLPANRTIERSLTELTWIKNELPPEKWRWAARQRQRLVPLQYILGNQPFGELTILCREKVLIPRWETEEWVQRLLDAMQKRQPLLTVVDVCTGSGCIPLAIKHRRPQDTVFGLDVSRDAIALSRDNLNLYQRQFDPDAKVTFMVQSVFESAPPAILDIDVLVSNPPYIPENEYRAPVLLNGVLRSVKRFEPALALVGDLEFYDALVDNYVVPYAVRAFVFEVGGIKQVEHVEKRVEKDYECVRYYDSAGNIRCVVGWRRNDGVCLREMCLGK